MFPPKERDRSIRLATLLVRLGMPIPGTAPSVVVGGAALFENARDSDFPQLIHYRATRLDMSI